MKKRQNPEGVNKCGPDQTACTKHITCGDGDRFATYVNTTFATLIGALEDHYDKTALILSSRIENCRPEPKPGENPQSPAGAIPPDLSVFEDCHRTGHLALSPVQIPLAVAGEMTKMRVPWAGTFQLNGPLTGARGFA